MSWLNGVSRVSTFFLLATACFAVDCASRETHASKETTERTVLASMGSPSAEIPLTFLDSVDLRPSLLRVSAAGIWLVDLWSQRVALLDVGGQLRWVLGRKGGGPAEFTRIRDARPLGATLLVVLDAGLGRLTFVNASGVASAHVALDVSAEQAIPLPDTSFVLFVLGPQTADSSLVHIGKDGHMQEHVVLHSKQLRAMQPMSAQLTLASNPRSGKWVAGMLTGPEMHRFDVLEGIGGLSTYLETVEPPEVIVQQPSRGERVTRLGPLRRAARRIAMDDSTIVVLFEGTGPMAGRLLDLYHMKDGSYIGTVTLDRSPRDIDFFNGTVFLLYEEPVPEIETLHLRF